MKRVRQLVGWAKKNRLITFNPIEGLSLPEEPRRQIGLEQAEIDAIVKYAHPRFSRYFRMCLLTGRRPGEIASLRRQDVDFDRASDGTEIVCLKLDSATRKSKTGNDADKKVPLCDEAAQIVKDAMKEAGADGVLFPSEEGCQYCEQSWNRPLRALNKVGRGPGQGFDLGHKNTKPRIRTEITMYFCRFEFINRR